MNAKRVALLGFALLCLGGFAAWMAYLFDPPIADPVKDEPHAASPATR